MRNYRLAWYFPKRKEKKMRSSRFSIGKSLKVERVQEDCQSLKGCKKSVNEGHPHLVEVNKVCLKKNQLLPRKVIGWDIPEIQHWTVALRNSADSIMRLWKN